MPLNQYENFLFFSIFGGHLEFLQKTENCKYLENSKSQSDFDRIFDTQGSRRCFLVNIKILDFFSIFGGHLEFLRKTENRKYLEKP